jgi:hypothetical protein
MEPSATSQESSSHRSIGRLREFLRQLPPSAQAMLAREFERMADAGQDAAIAHFVLRELRPLLRPSEPTPSSAPAKQAEAPRKPVPPAPRADAPLLERVESLSQPVFAVLTPFLADGEGLRPGQIRRAALEPLWTWLVRDAIGPAAAALEAAVAAAGDAEAPDAVRAIRQFQQDAALAIMKLATDRSALGRIGGQGLADDVASIGVLLAHRDAIEGLRGRLPPVFRVFTDTQIHSVKNAFEQYPGLLKPDVIVFAIATVMERLTAPWQIVRLAIAIAGSDEEGRVAATPFAAAVPMALHELSRVGAELRNDIRRGRFERSSQILKALHDGVRDFRTELDLKVDSAWSRQLSGIRAGISDALKAEIETVPGRVRRLLRHRADKDIGANATLDRADVDETAALIAFVAACRTFASELAVNEVTLRAFSDIQHYLETATESLVDSLRGGEPRARAFRQSQTDAAIRFCEPIFGRDYAVLMSRAADVALAVERKPQRAG